jgi:hypothetical protein
MKWRRTLHVLHRDVGFFCLGLTLVYAISGVAVNHREHWDHSFVSEEAATPIGSPATLLGVEDSRPPGVLARAEQDALVHAIGNRLGRAARPRKVFWRNRTRLSLFYGEADSDIVDYMPETGVAEHQTRRGRYLFRQLNFLHLNEPRGAWTWTADIYAVALTFLALSGVIMVKGRKGLKGRGALFAMLGLAVPVVGYLLLAP